MVSYSFAFIRLNKQEEDILIIQSINCVCMCMCVCNIFFFPSGVIIQEKIGKVFQLACILKWTPKLLINSYYYFTLYGKRVYKVGQKGSQVTTSNILDLFLKIINTLYPKCKLVQVILTLAYVIFFFLLLYSLCNFINK